MEMDKLVSLCKRRGFMFQSSEIYGGLNGFWDYGPLGTELKRNVKDAWWKDMVTGHDDSGVIEGAPEAYEMTGLDCTIIMHPQVWKCSGHYDLFHDQMVDCRESRRRYRYDQVRGRWVEAKGERIFVATVAEADREEEDTQSRALKYFNLRTKNADQLSWDGGFISLPEIDDLSRALGPDAKTLGTLTEPREFNLMFKTTVGALGGEEDVAFLRPETAQGIFVNFKNVLDSTRVRIPFGIAQIGKSFRNEITPRNFTFRSREFEQMEIEFFCSPNASKNWYLYWRDRRMKWYVDLGLAGEGQLGFPQPFRANPVGCGGEDLVLDGPSDHCILAVGQDEVGRVGDDLGAFEGQGSGRFGEDPIEADHHADLDALPFNNLEACIPRAEQHFLLVKEVGLAVIRHHAILGDSGSRVEEDALCGFCVAANNHAAGLSGHFT